MSLEFSPLLFEDNILKILDQRKIPQEETFIHCHTLDDGYRAIEKMIVRGAPCIGFTAIFSLALWLKNNKFNEEGFAKACQYLKKARPTAVNLQHEIDNTQIYIKSLEDKSDLYKKTINYGYKQIEKLKDNNTKMAKFAEKELLEIYGNKKLNILTHCNTGFLACGCIGTALGVIEHLGKNKINNVWVDETRPYLQGSRLTAFELSKLEIPYQIVVEGAASLLMEKGLVDAIFVGADRIVGNGDTANKIGTGNLSILAKYFNIPFYVVAPTSSFDITMPDGDEIEIEIRPESEITQYKNLQISAKNSRAYNPSFDITRGINITAIICETKCLKPPFIKSIKEIF